jgi:hypothetical protein
MLPSWVPDFSIPAGRGDLWLWDEHSEYAASGTSKPAVRFSEDIRTLFIRGIIVDKVMHVFGPFNTENGVLESLPSIVGSVCGVVHPHVQARKLVAKENLKRERSIEGPRDSSKAMNVKSEKITNEAVDKSAKRNFTDKQFSRLGTPSAICEALENTAMLACDGECSEEDLRELFLRAITTYAREWFSCSGSDSQVEQQIMPTLVPRCFFTTANKYIGIGPVHLKPGDEVCILFGGDAYYILRDHDEYHEFKGDAYIHRAMNGELLPTWILMDVSSPNGQEFILR